MLDPDATPLATRHAEPGSPEPSDWPALRFRDRVPVLIAVAAATSIVVTRLPPGVCYGDAGDLQLSSVTLGIMHPPGYPILSTIGFVLTRLPFLDGAYVVTLACALSGSIAAYLCGLIQLRLGVHSFIACTGVALFLGHPQVWLNFVQAEVYIPTLSMHLGAVYCFLRFASQGRAPHLYLAALLYGAALFTRPPTMFSLPFFLLAGWVVVRRRGIATPVAVKGTAIAAALAALPGLYALGFIILRDRPDVAYNYIEEYNAETGLLPDTSGGAGARLERAAWLMTGKQFERYMGTTWRRTEVRLRWIGDRAIPLDPFSSIAVFGLVIVGLIVAWRRARWAAIVLAGLVVQSVFFACAYRVSGQAANLLPLLAGTTIFLGIGTSAIIRRLPDPGPTVVAVIAAIVGLGGMMMLLHRQPDIRGALDARDAIAQADLATLPDDAVIIAAWNNSTPLRYAHYYANRPDVHIATVSPQLWGTFAAKFAGRPVFVPSSSERLAKTFRMTLYRNLYRLEPIE